MNTDTSWLKKYVPEFPELKEHTGASGYFSQPALILDPQLFDGEELKANVREEILGRFYNYMSTRYNNVHEWTALWLAGSGISYQWAADRGNGDLDVLFGVDYTEFVNSNPAFSGMDRYDISYIVNDDLRNNLWPSTSHIRFNRGDERPYEVTYYLNPGVGTKLDSITMIQPYAAYNLTENQWIIPPEANPIREVPHQFEDQAAANVMEANMLRRFYDMNREALATEAPHSPRWHNAMSGLKHVAMQAQALYDQIHSNRKQAFDAQGEGYYDFFNYQWQAAKRDGIVDILKQIADAAEHEQQLVDTQLYGAPIETDPRRLANAAVFSQNR